MSPYFSGITTVLTIYALFGDDLRLLLTSKPADPIFDIVTISTMAMFGIEVLACSVGKPGYLFGFFFFLDVLSTVTLVLDITTVSEDLFGDSVSNTSSEESSGGGDDTGDSAEAARAARMSRAGTKAGRVVRLIRLMRLIRLIKLYKKSGGGLQYQTYPGDDWDDDDEDQAVEKESAVSKKLSEMTTRRVIMLVLTIMLTLPFFQADMYKDKLNTSAQYGINVLYRRLNDDLRIFKPLESPSNRADYLASKNRKIYEEDFISYVYYHNSFCHAADVPSSATASPQSSFGRLFWLGCSPAKSNLSTYFLPGLVLRDTQDWDEKWNGVDWDYYQCNMPATAQGLLTMPWERADICLSGKFRGISLIKVDEPEVTCPDDLRYQERIVTYPELATDTEWNDLVTMVVFDKRSGSHMEAALNTAQTFFICLLLGVGAMTFSNDANKLVLMPIERMISKLEKIRNNPLAAMTIGDEEHHKEQVAASRKNKNLDTEVAPTQKEVAAPSLWKRIKDSVRRGSKRISPQTPEPMETVVLEKTIIKIGSLLALGFGEAGAEIIGQNMKGSDTSALMAMIPGRRVDAIFGFCDIRNFTDATEVLQDQVMLFVNRIAGVVHTCINEFFGSPNKNIGDAFLLVWRLSGYNAKKQERLADMSLISFVKIIAQINKSPLLAEYRSHPKLVKRLPNYRVRMGFGLHSGWAIEGAIGSEFKIDASYLSPNVNMAARLEAVTKPYGSLILISESLIQLMSEPIAEECRLIDNVAMIGSAAPFKLYTIDLDDLALEVERNQQQSPGKSAKFKQRFELQRKKNERWCDEYKMHEFFECDVDVKTMRGKFTVEFFCRFNMAYLNYEAGNWSVAKNMLEQTRFLLATEDGPSAALLRFMKQFSGVAPKGWPGHRILKDT